MNAADLASLLVTASTASSSGFARPTELGFHQGVVVEWNSATNTNVIRVGESSIPNVTVLATSDSVLLRPGDVVAVLRFRSTYFILGRVAVAGVNHALGLQAGTGGDGFGSTSSTTFTDLAGVFNGPGPQVTTYIGSARRAMVWMFSTPGAANQTSLFTCQAFASGTLLISEIATGLLTCNTANTIIASLSTFQLVTADHGLPGDTDVTFIMKFRVSGGTASFGPNALIVWPF